LLIRVAAVSMSPAVLNRPRVMRLDALPKSMVVLGGGYIAAEMGHIGSGHVDDVGDLGPGLASWTCSRWQRVGFQNSATVVDLGFLRGPLILVEEATEDGSAVDSYLGEVSDRVIGYGWAELAAAMRSPAVVVGLVLG
jgi:hypothetical protein